MKKAALLLSLLPLLPASLRASLLYNSVNSGGYSKLSSTPTSVSIGQSVVDVPASETTNLKSGFIYTIDPDPPAAITDFTATNSSTWTALLSWTAPGDDGQIGNAYLYEVRYATFTLDSEEKLDLAFQAADEPTPLPAGSTQSFTLTGLEDNTTYYFSIRAYDEYWNKSALSNSPITTTLDGTSPGVITDLVATSTGIATGEVTLTWTAPGDDDHAGRATEYDLRFSTIGIINTDNKFMSATRFLIPAPAVAGSSETVTITGLAIGKTYMFAIKTLDEAANSSGLNTSTPSATTLISTGTGTMQWVWEWDVNASSSIVGVSHITGDGTHIYLIASLSNGAHQIQKWTNTGIFVQAWGDDILTAVGDLAISEEGELFVSDHVDDKIYVYALTGGSPVREISATEAFKLAIDNHTHLFASQMNQFVMNIYTLSGTLIESWATAAHPDNIAVDSADNVFLGRRSTVEKGRVYKYTHGGENLKSFSGSTFAGSDADDFRSVASDLDNNLYALTKTPWDQAPCALVGFYKFDPNGNLLLSQINNGCEEAQSGLFDMSVQDIFFESNTSKIYLTNSIRKNIQVFQQSPSDVTPPGKIMDLAAQALSRNGVQLTWTAPGADMYGGVAASSYDLRYSTVTITNTNFSSQPQWPMPAPKAPGSVEITTIDVLTVGVTYYFALKATDNNGNESPISVIKSTLTQSDRSIVINEVAPGGESLLSDTVDHAEFFVAEKIKAAGFILYESTIPIKTFPTTGDWQNPLSTNTYIVLHINPGALECVAGDETNFALAGSAIDICGSYNSGAADPGLKRTDSVLILSDQNGLTFSSNGTITSGTIIDMVAWGDQDTVEFSTAIKNILISSTSPIQNHWTFAGAFPKQYDAANSRGLATGHAIGRDPNSQKSDPPSKYDWSFRESLTLGAANSADTTAASGGTSTMIHTITAATVAVTATTGSWTVSYHSNATSSTARHMLTIDIPTNWTTPQVSSNSISGYVWLSSPSSLGSLNYSTNSYAISVATDISGIAGRIIIPVGQLSAGTTVQVVYGYDVFSSSGVATVQLTTNPPTAIFTVRVDENGTNIGPLAVSPSLRVSTSSACESCAAPLVIGLNQNFKLGEVYAFPNPAKNGKSPVIHVEVGVADGVELKFYDAAGELIHQDEISGMPSIIDDGQGPQYAYEYIWQNNIPSGTYIYVIRAHKNGEGELKKISKLAVIR